jgi:hypothetical protein
MEIIFIIRKELDKGLNHQRKEFSTNLKIWIIFQRNRASEREIGGFVFFILLLIRLIHPLRGYQISFSEIQISLP